VHGEPAKNNHQRPRAALLLSLGVLAGCLEQTVDLRSKPPSPEADADVPCVAGERLNPEHDVCEPCTVMAPPPEQVCPCDFRFVAREFPYCASAEAAYECAPCTGSITHCRTFSAGSGTTTSCELLAACCRELALAPGALPCCAQGAKVDCAPAGILGEYGVSCVTESCCEGTLCLQGQSDCAEWQTCDAGLGRCVPACEPGVEYCCRECGCVCGQSDSN